MHRCVERIYLSRVSIHVADTKTAGVWVLTCGGVKGTAAACGVLNKQCEVTVRSAVVALQCYGGSGSRSGARQYERSFARRIGVLTHRKRNCETGLPSVDTETVYLVTH